MGRGTIVAISLFAAAVAAAVAAAAASGALPRTYTVQRVDSPNQTAGGDFGIGFVNTGDVNGDGKDDILVGTDEHGGGPGVVFIMSGATGTLIRSISSPEACYSSPCTGSGTPASFGSYVGKLADIGSCVGGTAPGTTCTSIGAADGVPDELVTALGVDVGFDCMGNTGVLVDAGLAYVVDGASGAILKRLSMPDCDLYEEFGIATPKPKPAFGRTILNPSSAYGPTAANLSGPTTPPLAVQIGDMNGGGQPDIVVSASDYYETGVTANPASDCASAPSNQCLQAGRSYVFYGESVLTTAGDVDKTPDQIIKNVAAQADDPTTPVNANRENLGYSIAPVGDIGRCTLALGPGAACPTASSTGTLDEKPDVAISSHRTDDFGMFDAGVVLLIDGSTGRVLYTYRHPEPQPASLFGFSNYNQPAVGDVGSSTAVDVYEAAMRQNNPYTGGGKGYAMNGAFKQGGSPNSVSFATLNDPTPHASEDFGTSSAGIGNVFGDGRTEILVGAYGPHNPGTNQNAINDVHIFSALDETELQRFEAPDQQPGLGFGTALAPMGDLNSDGFLDYAVGAGLWDGPAGADQGRIYVFRSDNSPAPAPPPAPPPPPAAPPASVLAGRSLELAVNKTTIRRGQRVVLRGLLEAFANGSSCEAKQSVKIQRRRPGRALYGGVRTVTTAANGTFSVRLKPTATYVYRARVEQTASCLGAVSDRRLVKVRRRR